VPKRHRPEPDPPLRVGRLVAVIALGGAFVGAVFLLAPPAPTPDSTTPVPAPLGSESAAPAITAPAPPSVVAPVDAGPPELPYLELDGGTLGERNDVLIQNMQRALGLDDSQVASVRAIFAASTEGWIGQGNPTVSVHPLSRAECLDRRAQATKLAPADPRCGSPNMVPLYDPSVGETAATARACIDQFEFPNIACEYPVVWVRANEAQALCHALGKRLCDTHEWEGACAGAVKPPETEYPFNQRRIQMAYDHNTAREIVWAYGKTKNHALCASGSQKSKTCPLPSFRGCGTNDYPAGAFPECVSPLGVYDQHGNAAEHMNFPRKLEELGSRGGSGETEMKGSWFIFGNGEAHIDDCRWRAPDWHVTKVADKNSHRNYHLGFRCCRDLPQ
jgi:formylglycine-generating enzyme